MAVREARVDASPLSKRGTSEEESSKTGALIGVPAGDTRSGSEAAAAPSSAKTVLAASARAVKTVARKHTRTEKN
ncbi:hypothetical protein GCM10027034_02730 [Ramlibacter solisilvae]